jgi:hypothetical protein
VLRPEGAGERLYRLGLHVNEPFQEKLFGTRSLDFPPQPRVQHGTLEIDLRDRSSRGEIAGHPIQVEVSSFEHDAGSFSAAAVWWQFNPLEQLQIEPMLWFLRQRTGAVQVLKATPRARLQILTAP